MANTKENTNKQHHHHNNHHHQQSLTMRQPQQQYTKRAEVSAAPASASASSSSLAMPSPPSPTHSSISTASSSCRSKRKNIKLSKLYPFIGDTYRDLRKYISVIGNDLNSSLLIEIINKYRKGCNEVYPDALEYLEVSRMLSENIVRVLDLLQDMSTTCINLDEYYHRACELIAIFISGELRVSTDTNEDDCLIASRIVYTMRKHLTQEDEEATRYNILRTLVYIPRFFNAREIMCAIFETLIPLKAATEVTQLPDKQYMLYIIVFYRWMQMQKDNDGQQLIINFAEGFMKPKVSLCTNLLYCQHLARYTRHSEATRTILKNMQFYTDLKNACIIDNAFKVSGGVVNLCDDDDDDDVVVLDDSSEVLSFAELFSAVQLETSKPKVKREEKTIVDSVDLTVDDDDDEANDLAARLKRERHDKWLDNLELLAKQFRELQKRNDKSTTANVICLDSDSEELEEVSVIATTTITEKETNGIARKTPGASNGQTTETDDLFDDSYPITVTPIDSNANLDISDNEAGDDDGTQLAPRFLPNTLRTYEAKKGSNGSVSSADEHPCPRRIKPIASSSSPSATNRKALPAKKIICRRNTTHSFSSTPLHLQQGDDDGESTDNDASDINNRRKTTKHRPVKSMGPGVPYESLKTTFGGGEKVIFSQPMPSRLNRNHSHSQDEEQNSPKRSEQKSKRVHFDSSPMGPTAAYSKQKLANMDNSNNNNSSAETTADYFRANDTSFRSTSSLNGSTTSNTTASVSNDKQQQEQEEHKAAAATLFRNIFDRSRNNRLSSICSSSYSSMLSPNSTLSSKPATGMLSSSSHEEEPPQLKKSVLKLNRLKQRRSTICARSDLNDYMAQYSTLSHTNDKQNRSPCRNFDWEGASLSQKKVSEHLDVAVEANVYKDRKLAKRCAVIIRPTKELLQYERKRDAMYNEILQKQRRKLELRALEKLKEKERRRQEKQQKREQFQREQSETMKQLERMKLTSKSDEEEAAANVSRREQLQINQLYPLISPRCTPEKRPWTATEQVSDTESQELAPPPKRRSPEPQNSQPPPKPQFEMVESQTVEKTNTHETEQQEESTVAIEEERVAAVSNITDEKAQNTLASPENLNAADDKGQNKTKLPIVCAQGNDEPSKKQPRNRKTKSKNGQISDQAEAPLTQNDNDSGELDQMPLLQRKTKLKKSISEKPHELGREDVAASPQPQRTKRLIEKSPRTPNRAVRECRKSVALKDDYPDAKKAALLPGRITQERRRSLFVSAASKQPDVEQTTDSEIEAHQPARITKGRRRKSVCAQSSSNIKDFELTTDSEMETEQRPPSVLRQSPRFKERQSPSLQQKPVEQSNSDKESQSNMSPPKTLKRMSKNVKQKPTETETEAMSTEKTKPQQSSLTMSSETEAEAETEASIVAVIAKRLSSPDTTTMPKEIESSEHEEILETLEDLLKKETRLRAQLNDIPEEGISEDIQANETTNMVGGNNEHSTDVDMQSVIENIVLNEIQREMDADMVVDVNISKTVPTETSLAPFPEDHITHTKRVVINFEDEVLEEMLGTSLPISQTNAGGGEDLTTSSLPLLINNVEYLGNLQENDKLGQGPADKTSSTKAKDVAKSREKVLVTENIYLGNVRGLSTTHANATTEEEEDTFVVTPVQNEKEASLTQAEIAEMSLPKLTLIVPPILPSTTEHKAAHLHDMPLLDINVAKGSEEHVSPVLDAKERATQETNDEKQLSKRTQSSPINELDKDSPESPEQQEEEQEYKQDKSVQSTINDTTNRTGDQFVEPTNLPIRPLKTKASLKMPSIRKCQVNIERLNMTPYIKGDKQKKKRPSQLPAELTSEEDRSSYTSSPAETVHSNLEEMEECYEYEHTNSSDQSSNAVTFDENLNTEPEDVESEATSNGAEYDLSLDGETPGTSPLPTKQKSKNGKTVTFNLVAQIIPSSPASSYTSSDSFEYREQMSPNDYNWNSDEEADAERIHRYYSPLSMITPARRKHYNDDLMTTSNTNTSCSSTDTEDEEKRIEALLATTKDTTEDNRQLNRSPVSLSDGGNNDFHSFPEYVTEEIVVETSSHHFSTQSNVPQPMNATMTDVVVIPAPANYMTIETADENVPVYLFSDEIVDLVPADSLLVSSTYVNCNGNDAVKIVANKSMMSPSEQEVSSTQESFFQSPSKPLTKKDGESVPDVIAKTTAEDKRSTGVLQNNQVDTTNHSPEMLPPQTSNKSVNAIASSTITTSSQETKPKGKRRGRRPSSKEEKPKSKDKSKSTQDSKSSQDSSKKQSSITQHDSSNDSKTSETELKKNVANDNKGGHNSPSTTTCNVDNNVPNKSKASSFKIPKIKSAIEAKDTLQKCSGARNPFVVRPSKTNDEIKSNKPENMEEQPLAHKDVATQKPKTDNKVPHHKQNRTETAKSTEESQKPKTDSLAKKDVATTKQKTETAKSSEDSQKPEPNPLAKKDVATTKQKTETAKSSEESQKSEPNSLANKDESKTKSKAEKKMEHHKQKAETAKSEGSQKLVNKDVATTKSKTEKKAEHKQKTETAKLEGSSSGERVDKTNSKAKKQTTTVKSNGTLVNEENPKKQTATVKSNGTLANEENPKKQTAIVKSNGTLGNEENPKKQTATVKSNGTLGNEENPLQPTTTPTAKSEQALAKGQQEVPVPVAAAPPATKPESAAAQKTTAGKKRESSSLAPSNERKLKKTELQATIDVEIQTMATELSVPKSIAEELAKTTKSKDKHSTKEAKSKDNAAKSKTTTSTKSHERQEGDTTKVPDLREPTTTGIKSAVSHGSRKYSPKRKSSSHAAVKTTANKTNLNLTTTTAANSSSTLNTTSTSSSKTNGVATTSKNSHSTSSDKSNSNTNSTTTTKATNTTPTNTAAVVHVGPSSSSAASAEISTKLIQSTTTTAAKAGTSLSSSNSCASDSTTLNAANQVRKKQKIK